MEYSNAKDRLIKYLEIKKISQGGFEKKTGLSNGFVSKVGDAIRENSIKKISVAYPDLNIAWLRSGVGEILISTDDKKIAIRYYDIEGSAGRIEMFDPGNGSSYKDIIIPGFGDCDIALNVWGDSMEPELCNGSIAICKETSKEIIDYGHIFFIITRQDNRMFKYLKKATNQSKVLCTSANDFFDPFEINIDDILKLYIVKGHIERSAV